MPSQVEITPVYVKYIPEEKQQGILYISKEYNTTSHLCLCGCGNLTVIPIHGKDAGWWNLIEEDGKVSIYPSIGNQKICGAHYWIKNNIGYLD